MSEPSKTKMHKTVDKHEISIEFFKARKILRDSVGPSTYRVTPNIQKRNHNTKTFDTALRRYKFNQKVEATDRLVKL